MDRPAAPPVTPPPAADTPAAALVRPDADLPVLLGLLSCMNLFAATSDGGRHAAGVAHDLCLSLT